MKQTLPSTAILLLLTACGSDAALTPLEPAPALGPLSLTDSGQRLGRSWDVAWATWTGMGIWTPL